MVAHKRNGGFRIRRIATNDHGFSYSTFQVVGYLNGERIRTKCKNRDLALGELNRLEVLAANAAGGEIRPVNTRLTPEQVRTAETLFALTPEPLAAIQWYLRHYQPPVVSVPVETGCAEFMRDREGEVSAPVIRDYRKVTGLLLKTFPQRTLETISTPELEAIMGRWGASEKSWNNLRTYLHAFFEFCAHDARRWVATNPVRPIRQYAIARGIPLILGAANVQDMFAFLEMYSGPKKAGHKPGYLVPYFALATFAGIRPSVKDGEIRKIHELENKSQIVDVRMGVVRIVPEIAKTNDLRQVTIQPNLRAWLTGYPLSEFPLIVPNMSDHVAVIRKKFGLGVDVLRHTFISMYVAKFKSMGEAALQAGNSEAMIKKHYLNLVAESEAMAFWRIAPKRRRSVGLKGSARL